MEQNRLRRWLKVAEFFRLCGKEKHTAGVLAFRLRRYIGNEQIQGCQGSNVRDHWFYDWESTLFIILRAHKPILFGPRQDRRCITCTHPIILLNARRLSNAHSIIYRQ